MTDYMKKARNICSPSYSGAVRVDDAQHVEDVATALREAERDALRRAAEWQSRAKFKLGDRVTKTRGSSWTGRIVGFYCTALTPIGYCVESENEPGSVQNYPEAALKAAMEAGR